MKDTVSPVLGGRASAIRPSGLASRNGCPGVNKWVGDDFCESWQLTISFEVEQEKLRHDPPETDAGRGDRHAQAVENGRTAKAGALEEVVVARPGKAGTGEQVGKCVDQNRDMARNFASYYFFISAALGHQNELKNCSRGRKSKAAFI